MPPIPYPHPIPPCRTHRCRHPVLHSLGVLSVLGLWAWYSLHTMGTWGKWAGHLADPKGVGYGLLVGVAAELLWVLLLPGGLLTLFVWGMWRCTGPRRFVPAEVLQPPDMETPRIVRRVILEEVYYPEPERRF